MIRLFEGEDVQASKNRFLVEFELIGLPAAPRGQTEIDVTIDVNRDTGELVVTAAARRKECVFSRLFQIRGV